MFSKAYRVVELLVLFVCVPLSFFWSYPIVVKVGLGFVGFMYILLLMKKMNLLKFQKSVKTLWKPFLKEILWKLLVIMLITTCYVYFVAPEKLFIVFLKNPALWIGIIFVYTIFSVWPQEVLYRTFFFNRYQSLVLNKWLLILINALVFSLAHLFLKNMLVLALTFIGGLLFAHTYYTKRSTLLVSIEHCLYGNWLFTVGMGEMLAFPGAD